MTRGNIWRASDRRLPGRDFRSPLLPRMKAPRAILALLVGLFRASSAAEPASTDDETVAVVAVVQRFFDALHHKNGDELRAVCQPGGAVHFRPRSARRLHAAPASGRNRHRRIGHAQGDVAGAHVDTHRPAQWPDRSGLDPLRFLPRREILPQWHRLFHATQNRRGLENCLRGLQRRTRRAYPPPQRRATETIRVPRCFRWVEDWAGGGHRPPCLCGSAARPPDRQAGTPAATPI